MSIVSGSADIGIAYLLWGGISMKFSLVLVANGICAIRAVCGSIIVR